MDTTNANNDIVDENPSMFCAAPAPTSTGAIEFGNVRGRVPSTHWVTVAMPPIFGHSPPTTANTPVSRRCRSCSVGVHAVVVDLVEVVLEGELGREHQHHPLDGLRFH